MANLKLIDGGQMTFDYGAVPAPVAVEAREAAQRIRLRLRRSAEDIIEIGRDLLSVKATLPHGSFLPWIEAEFGMGQSTAYNFMKVAESYGAKLPMVGNLAPTALYALASAEPDVQARIEEMLASGEIVTKAQIDDLRKNLKSKIKDLRKEVKDADEDADALKDELDKLRTAQKDEFSVKVDEAAREIEQSHAAEEERLRAESAAKDREIAELRQQLAGQSVIAPVPNTATVIQLHRDLTDAEKAEIDAETDPMKGADFDTVASPRDRAAFVLGATHQIATTKANASVIFKQMTKGFTPEVIARNRKEIEQVIALLNKVLENFDGK